MHFLKSLRKMQLIFITYGNTHDFNRRIAVFEKADGDAHTKIEQILLGTYTVGAFEQPAKVAAVDIAVSGQALNGQRFVVAIFNFFDRPLQMPGFVTREGSLFAGRIAD